MRISRRSRTRGVKRTFDSSFSGKAPAPLRIEERGFLVIYIRVVFYEGFAIERVMRVLRTARLVSQRQCGANQKSLPEAGVKVSS